MKKKNLVYFTIFLIFYLILLYSLYLIERNHPETNIDSFFNAFWYSIVTLTTVGYGDYYPATVAGKLIGLFFVLGSLGILGFLISQLNYKINAYMEAKKYGQQGLELADHIIIFGFNKFSQQVVSEIAAANEKCVVVSNSKADLDAVIDKYQKNENLHVFHCEYDAYADLAKIHINRAKCVYVSFTDDSESLVHILNIQAKYKDLKIIVNLNKPFLKETFKNAGVLFSISQEEIASKLIASYMFEPNAAEITEDIMSGTDENGSLDLKEFVVEKDHQLLSKTYDEAFVLLKQKFNAVLVGIYKNTTGTLLKNPKQEIKIEKGDRLVCIADADFQSQMR